MATPATESVSVLPHSQAALPRAGAGGEPLDILMVAYACSPKKRGEHLLGWEWASRLARRHRVTVLTRSTHPVDSEGMRPGNLTLIGVEDRAFRFLRRLGWPGLAAYYWVWQIAAARAGRRLLGSRHFDVVHQTTFHTCRIPGRLAAPGNPPFIWGPVAGLERVPARMLPTLGPGAVRELVRALANVVTPHLPSVRRTLKYAHTVLVSNQETLRRLRAAHPRQYVLLSANAVEPDDLPRHRPADGLLELVAVGSLVRIRGFDLALGALAALTPGTRARMRLTFVGDGRDLPRLRRLARRFGVTGSVRFLGAVPRSEALAVMSRAHLLVFPSLRDSGGSAVAEAMTMGLPVLALDQAGPGSMLARGGGFLVLPGRRREVVSRLAAVLERVGGQPAILTEAGVQGREIGRRVFGWGERIHRMERLYAVARAEGRRQEIAS